MDCLCRSTSRVSPAPDPRFDLPKPYDASRPPIGVFINNALASIWLPELRRIIAEYAAEWFYIWRSQSIVGPSAGSWTVSVGGQIISDRQPEDDWIKFAAAHTLSEGPHRWRILTEFGLKKGRVAVGITNYPAAKFIDCLTATVLHPSDRSNQASVQFRIGNSYGDRTGFLKSRMAVSITLIEVDLPRRTMTTIFRDSDGWPATVKVGLPYSKTNWRPLVAVAGAVAVRILPWFD
jgi:hypothetical protein